MHLIHRGIINKNHKENLLKSFLQSFKKGYGIETDIHATKDEKFICFHDFTLKRIFKDKSSIKNLNYSDIEKKIISILDSKIRPAVARDGGDIKFHEFKDGKVKVILKGSCSGCPSSTLTLKKGVENLLCHYIPEVKEVLAV